ncbi:hypothetical protein ENSA5_60150 [Enhygromyxa salina]|uniref:Uncharacterized protein n=1 Tax=Enhygromyxa salina TaxID=215803 RepID=A0A2S9XDV2_9BACT|nr:hypothetical protein [Enhygromyxa salina]PRP90940.1 hypothetical protein ENSA5_60150 [Enhygromyxa salina]
MTDNAILRRSYPFWHAKRQGPASMDEALLESVGQEVVDRGDPSKDQETTTS